MTGAELRAHTPRINDATYAAWNARDPDAVAAACAVTIDSPSGSATIVVAARIERGELRPRRACA